VPGHQFAMSGGRVTQRIDAGDVDMELPGSGQVDELEASRRADLGSGIRAGRRADDLDAELDALSEAAMVTIRSRSATRVIDDWSASSLPTASMAASTPLGDTDRTRSTSPAP